MSELLQQSAWNEAGAQPTLLSELRAVLAILRRRAILIIAVFVIGVVGAITYLLLATPIYRATAQVTLDPRRLTLAQPSNVTTTQRRDEPLIDQGRADSEAQTMASETVVRSAVVALKLQNEPTLVPPPGLKQRVLTLLGLLDQSEPGSEEDKILWAVALVGNNLNVGRVDKSYVYTVSFDSSDPVLAARVANGIVDAYINDQFKARAETGQAAAEWLKQQLAQLAKQASEADAQAVAFRRDNNISLVDGKPVDEQQLTNLTTQLSDAIAAKADAKAHLDRISELDPNQPDVLLSDSFKNDVITKLRQQYSENANRAARFAGQYGSEHGAVLKLKAENETIAASIRAEMKRYQDGYRSDYEIASAKERSLREQLDQQFRRVSDIGAAQVKLNEFDSNAKTFRAAYEAVLQRYSDVVPKHSFPVSEARLISAAVPPTQVYKPRTPIVLALGSGAALLLGLAAAFGLELSDRGMRTRRDAEEMTGASCLGHIPVMGFEKKNGGGAKKKRLWFERKKPLPTDYVTQNPFSIAAETLRSVKTSIDLANVEGRTQVIGIMSCLPHEGKTTVAANLAHLLALGGASVLLIDGDMRNPQLTRLVAPAHDGASLPQLLRADPIANTAVRLPSGGFDFISLYPGQRLPASADTLGSPHMKALLDRARKQYNYVVLDLAPVLAVVDVKMVTPLVDSFLMVIDWAKTSRNAVEQALSSAPSARDKLIGCVFNRTKIATLGRYGENVQAYYNGHYFRT